MFLVLILLGLAFIPTLASIVYKRDLLSPINIFSFLYSLSFGFVPLLNRFNWITLDGAYAAYTPTFELRAHIVAIIGLMFVYCGYYEGAIATALTRALPAVRGVINYQNTKFLILLLFLVSGCAFLFFAVYFNIKVQHITDYFIYTNISAFGRGHLAFLASLYLPAGFAAIIGMFNKQSSRQRLFFFLSLACTGTLAILSKSRGQVLILLFVILIFYNYRIKRISAAKIASIFFAMLIIVFVIAQFRGSLNFQLTKTNIANTFGGLFEEDQATAVVLSQYSKEQIAPAYGKIFLEETVLALIPRKIWSTKPTRYGGVVVTDIMVPNRQQGYYYTIGPFGLAYADFGYVGIVIAMITIGFTMRVAYEYVQRNKKNNGMLLWYALFCFSLWAFIRGGWGFIPVILSQTLLVVFINYFMTHSLNIRPRILGNRK